MRLATWNVNSLKARQDRVDEWLGYCDVDVVCLQETKMANEQFPHDRFMDLGYHSVHVGEGRWNGVAILSREPLDDVHHSFADGLDPDQEARLITATTAGVCVTSVYVPNGRAVDDDHYKYKLAWLDRLHDHIDAVAAPSNDVLVAGDFNVAPADIDVWDTTKTSGGTHVTKPERDALARLYDWGLTDVFREHHQEPGLFSWWDYRGGAFHKREGMRIDLLLTSTSLTEASTFSLVDRTARKGKLPSDHAPVFLDVTR
ncbi:MAG: exodeoxyribonuclease III [Actinobacteria bacterium]|nr:exodeoxyribonuclease III [Actinomycetota bacterium]